LDKPDQLPRHPHPTPTIILSYPTILKPPSHVLTRCLFILTQPMESSASSTPICRPFLSTAFRQ
jgi:hypothetical protein